MQFSWLLPSQYEAMLESYSSEVASLKNQITIKDSLLTISSKRYKELVSLQIVDNTKLKSLDIKENRDANQINTLQTNLAVNPLVNTF